ncbi:MAG: hypothetical protein HZB12_02315 [Candidatus Yonathbacteria bacterium]|nr:hypothetical protein [Candidatus Yonathbacteria bacterium]
MNKKILGMILMTVFMGMPSFAMAWTFRYCDVGGATVEQTSGDFLSTADCDSVKAFYVSDTVHYYNVNVNCYATQPASPGVCPLGTSAMTGSNVSSLTSSNLAVSTPLANPIKYRTFSGFVSRVTATAVEILMPFVVLAFIWSGFLFVRAQGKDEALTEAKTAIKWSIVGAFILMGAYGFSQIICTTVVSISGEPTNSCQ